ncbi:MAG: hypothetical protein MJ010_07140 [Paludibacteraceae bacterium]|nr:hypothetical protein [Paludibacteraceae bacterium]
MKTKNLLKSLKNRLGLVTAILAMLVVSQGAMATDCYLKGNFDNWGTGKKFEGTSYPYVLHTNIGTNYTCEFKIQIGTGDDSWYGNNGTINADVSDLSFTTSGGNCKISLGSIGDVTFIVTSGPTVQVIYGSLYGDFGSGWKDYYFESDGSVSVNISFTGDKEFKVKKKEWFGINNTPTMTRSSCTDWGFYQGQGNVKVNADVTGTYTFTWDETNKKLSVTYPIPSPLHVAGNGSGKGSWCCGKNWVNNECAMTNRTKTFNDVPASDDLEFQITNGSWDWKSYTWDGDDSEMNGATASQYQSDKIKIQTTKVQNITISYNDNSTIHIKCEDNCTPPTITSHPSTVPKTYTQGDDAEPLSVTASGTSLSYQWKQSSSADGFYENVTGGTGANTATYTPSTDNIGKLYYKCYVSNSCGNVTSNASGAITVTAGSDITVTPASPKAYEVITLSTRSGGDMVWSKTVGNDNAYFVNADGTTTSGPTTAESIKFKAPAGDYTITATPAAGGDSIGRDITVGVDSDDCN